MDRFTQDRRLGLLSRFAVLFAAVAMLVVSANVQAAEPSAVQLTNRRCFNCHGQNEIADMPGEQRLTMVHPSETPLPGTVEEVSRPGLYVAPDGLSASVHVGLSCVQCHADADKLPHNQRLARVDCAACHTAAAAEFRQSVHADAEAHGDHLAPKCVTCHGDHDIRPHTNRSSRTYPLNIIKVCGDCHEKHISKNHKGVDPARHIQHYLESVHGKALSEGGLIVAASCVDCHGPHKTLPSADPRSTVNRQQVTKTCGQCHVGVAEVYATSIHGQKLAQGVRNAPVCTDCHTAHDITLTSTPSFMLDIVKECGDCHNKPPRGSTSSLSLYDTYRRSYHGQVNRLGNTRAARCSSCHGAHDILEIKDPNSRLFPANRTATCAHCHPGSTPQFAKFQAHADFHDAQRFPLLHGVWIYFVLVMSSAFGFFGLHSLLWFVRSMIERVRHGPHPRHKAGSHGIVRFNRVDRINHAFVILTFFGLTLTGMPLLFSDHHWAMVLANIFGGVEACGLFHRVFAIMLAGNFIVHGLGVYHRWKARKSGPWQWLVGPNSMLPRWKDVTDCLGMWRWFFRGGSKPAFDRWTYWEKFDYWAEIFGTMIIGGSGLMLWFPTVVANFMPGWIFNVAMIVHGYEALLAVGFIFTIHFFNAHLRMEKFPVDDVMFTGQLPEDEFKEERAVEYARLVKEGGLEALRVKPAPKWQRIVAVSVGVLAMAIGTTMVVLIILAGLGVL